MRAGGHPAEPGGDAGAMQSVFHHGLAAGGIAQEDRRLVKRHTLVSELQDSAGEPYRLQAVAGSGKEREEAVIAGKLPGVRRGQELSQTCRRVTGAPAGLSRARIGSQFCFKRVRSLIRKGVKIFPIRVWLEIGI